MAIQFPTTTQELDKTLQTMKDKGATKEEMRTIYDGYMRRKGELQLPPQENNLSTQILGKDLKEKSTLLSRGTSTLASTFESGDLGFLERTKRFTSGLLKTTGGAIEKGTEAVLGADLNPFAEGEQSIGKGVGKVVETSGKVLDTLAKPIEQGLRGILGEERVKNIQESTDKALAKGEEFYEGMTQEQKDVVQSLFEVATVLPIGKFLKTGTKGAAGLIPGKKTMSGFLEKSAQKSTEKILAPTKEVTKQATKKVLSELPEKLPIATSLESLGKKVEKKLKKASSEIDYFIEKNGVKGKTSTKKLSDSLERIKEEYIIDGKIIDEKPIKIVEGLQETISKFGDEIPNDTVLRFRRKLDKIVSKSKGFLKTVDEGTDIGAKKELANAMRRELAKSNPDLAKLNKEYSFWANVDEVLEETKKRKTGQSGGLSKEFSTVAGGIVGASGGSTLEGVLGAVVFRELSKLTSSTLWRSLGSKFKNKLSKALISGDKKQLKNLLKSKEIIGVGAVATKEKASK